MAAVPRFRITEARDKEERLASSKERSGIPFIPARVDLLAKALDLNVLDLER